MPMPSILKSKSILPSTIGLAGLVAGGTGGYFTGKRRGAETMATTMSSQFMAANQKENQQLAKHFYLKGLQHNSQFKKESSMDKIALLQEVHDEAFHDELDKIAAISGDKIKAGIAAVKGMGGKAVKAVKSGLKSTGTVAKEVGGVYKEMGKDVAGSPAASAIAAGTVGLAGGVMSERYGANLQRQGKKRNLVQYMVTPTQKKSGETYYMKRAK